MVNTGTLFRIANSNDPDRQVSLGLPFTEDEYAQAMSDIGLPVEDEETDLYDVVMQGAPIPKYEIVNACSDIPGIEGITDLFEASDLVERAESLSEYEYSIFLALLDDGDSIEEALENIDDGDVDFYPNMDLAELAEQFADEGIISKEILESHIDWEGVGRELSFDGYREVQGGVLYRQ